MRFPHPAAPLDPADLDLLPAGIPDDFTLFLPTNASLKEVLVGGPIPSVVRGQHRAGRLPSYRVSCSTGCCSLSLYLLPSMHVGEACSWGPPGSETEPGGRRTLASWPSTHPPAGPAAATALQSSDLDVILSRPLIPEIAWRVSRRARSARSPGASRAGMACVPPCLQAHGVSPCRAASTNGGPQPAAGLYPLTKKLSPPPGCSSFAPPPMPALQLNAVLLYHMANIGAATAAELADEGVVPTVLGAGYNLEVRRCDGVWAARHAPAPQHAPLWAEQHPATCFGQRAAGGLQSKLRRACLVWNLGSNGSGLAPARPPAHHALTRAHNLRVPPALPLGCAFGACCGW